MAAATVHPMHLCLMAAAAYFARQEEAARICGLPLEWLRRRWGHLDPTYDPARHLLDARTGEPIFAAETPTDDLDRWMRLAQAYGPFWQACEPVPLERVLADLCDLLAPPRSSEAFYAALARRALEANLAALSKTSV